jgi:hypothetical protein
VELFQYLFPLEFILFEGFGGDFCLVWDQEALFLSCISTQC